MQETVVAKRATRRYWINEISKSWEKRAVGFRIMLGDDGIWGRGLARNSSGYISEDHSPCSGVCEDPLHRDAGEFWTLILCNTIIDFHSCDENPLVKLHSPVMQPLLLVTCNHMEENPHLPYSFYIKHSCIVLS